MQTSVTERPSTQDWVLLAYRTYTSCSAHQDQDNNNNNNNLFYIVPQQQLYELLALYRSTNVIKHISMLLKLA